MPRTMRLAARRRRATPRSWAGRSQVAPWSQSAWDRAVCTVAREVVLQKFRAVPGLDALLLGTGQAVIAEMTRNDANWGTGVDIGRARNPSQWRGTNILGWALMAARAQLARERPDLLPALALKGSQPHGLHLSSATSEAEAEPPEPETSRAGPRTCKSRERSRAHKRLQHTMWD